MVTTNHLRELQEYLSKKTKAYWLQDVIATSILSMCLLFERQCENTKRKKKLQNYIFHAHVKLINYGAHKSLYPVLPLQLCTCPGLYMHLYYLQYHIGVDDSVIRPHK